MQNDKKNFNTRTRRAPSVEETTAAIAMKQEREEAANSLPQSDESAAFESLNQNSSSVEEESRKVSSEEQTLGSDGRPLFEPKGIYFSTDSHGTDERAKRVLADLQREQKSRVLNPSLLLDDLRELGMYGELSDDNCHINMPFEEDVYRLVTTMRMAELILNDRVQTSRKEKMAEIKTQLDAEHCPNMRALLAEFGKARDALTQKHSFRSIGAFEADAYNLEGLILFETMLIARAVD
jgi:hypothetical protein